MTLHEMFARFARERAEAIEEQLAVGVALGLDVAVSETWDGLAMTLKFEFIQPGAQPPPGCTLYRASEIHEPRRK